MVTFACVALVTYTGNHGVIVDVAAMNVAYACSSQARAYKGTSSMSMVFDAFTLGQWQAAYQLDQCTDNAMLIATMKKLAEQASNELATLEGDTSQAAETWRMYWRGILSRCD